MNVNSESLTQADFIALITRGTVALTPAAVQRLVADLPDIRERFALLREAGHPEPEQQFSFLSRVVERVWTDQYREMPYGAALEAAFAISYFIREGDLIPDSLGPIGFIDDIAVAQTVLVRHATAFQAFCATTNLPVPDLTFREEA
jgi:hypothetical protein